MKNLCRNFGWLCALQFFAIVPAHSVELLIDRSVTIHSAREATARRHALIAYLWGSDGFPAKRLPDTVTTNVSTPVQHLHHLARVDEFRMNLAPGLEGLSYHFIPERPNG